MISSISKIEFSTLGRGVLKALLALALLAAPMMYATSRYTVGLEQTLGSDCLPWGVYLIDTWDTDIQKGDLVAFRTSKLEPFYPDGVTVVKIAAGVPGDRVVVSSGVISVNGKNWGDLIHAKQGGRLLELGATMEQYDRDVVLNEGELLALGTHPRSYDGRYYGAISTEEVIGRAISLW